MPDAIATVPARRHPHQVLIAALLAVSGTAILLGGPKPGSVDDALPPPLVFLWAGVLAAGGLMVVAAAFVPALTALFLELMADPPLTIMCAVYATAIAMSAGARAAVPVSLIAGVSAAFAVRSVQVFRALMAVRRELSRRRESGE